MYIFVFAPDTPCVAKVSVSGAILELEDFKPWYRGAITPIYLWS